LTKESDGLDIGIFKVLKMWLKNGRDIDMFRKVVNKFLPGDVYSFYYDELEKQLMGSSTILDLACGNNSPISEIKGNFKSTGLDIFEPYLVESKEKGVHDDYVISDVMKLNQKISPKSFDAVIALDLIEHLEKSDGFRLIEMMEKIAISKVIIFTPNGFLKQEPYDDNLWQEHKSGWNLDDFKNLEFKVFGQGGLKPLRGERAELRYRPSFIWSRISYITQILLRNNPKYSYQLLCVKSLKD
jgi:hypothetical protein